MPVRHIDLEGDAVRGADFLCLHTLLKVGDVQADDLEPTSSGGSAAREAPLTVTRNSQAWDGQGGTQAQTGGAPFSAVAVMKLVLSASN